MYIGTEHGGGGILYVLYSVCTGTKQGDAGGGILYVLYSVCAGTKQGDAGGGILYVLYSVCAGTKQGDAGGGGANAALSARRNSSQQPAVPGSSAGEGGVEQDAPNTAVRHQYRHSHRPQHATLAPTPLAPTHIQHNQLSISTLYHLQ